jgi:hypothetical protein
MNKAILSTFAIATLISFQASALETLVCGLVNSANSAYAQTETKGSGEYTIKLDCDLDGQVTPRDPVIEIDSFATDPSAQNAKRSDASRRGWITQYKQDLVKNAAQSKQANPRAASPYVCMVANVTAAVCGANPSEASITNVLAMTSAKSEQWIKSFKANGTVKGIQLSTASIEE